MNINNIVYTDDRIKDKQHFLDFLELTGYSEKDIKTIYSHEKLLKEVVNTYVKIYDIIIQENEE
jgi:hypothetical protein|tara:strand:- start:449 stop:640 length:192 start_codon:yes stop_codon:yes gene_type:complete